MYRNDLTDELESLANRSPGDAAPQLLDLVHRLLSERHAYRVTLELIASGCCNSTEQMADHAREVCSEYVQAEKGGKR